MKKLLCGFVCAAAGAALAVDSPTVATVDVIAINSGLTNTVVAIPGLDLAGGNLAVSNLVKTTNLKAGDTLYAFDNGKYDTWRLDADGGHWQHAENKYIITAGGIKEDTAPASTMQMSVGSGIWLSRCGTGSTTDNPFYVYAAHVDGKTSIVVGSSVTLVGNPLASTSASAPSRIDNKAKGDEIQIPQNGTPLVFTYNGTEWVSWSTGNRVVGFPAIVPGTGFWYRPADGSGRTIHW